MERVVQEAIKLTRIDVENLIKAIDTVQELCAQHEQCAECPFCTLANTKDTICLFSTGFYLSDSLKALIEQSEIPVLLDGALN